MDFYKKLFIVFFTIIIISIFTLKFGLSIVENKILNILKSEKFNVFMEQKLKNELNKLSSKELSEEEVIFYSENIQKILDNWQPVIDKIK